jgi:hypothetical protein
MKIDLTKINELDFLEKFDTLLNIIIENIKTLQFDISSYLNKDIYFYQTIFDQTIVVKVTVKYFLHNIDIVSYST